MALTDNCDIFASLHEDAANTIIRQALKQAPMIFNYATPAIIADPKRLCCELRSQLPPARAISVMAPLPIPGTTLGLDWCFQICRLELDFHPGNITLPQELSPPLREQRFSSRIELCLGIACSGKTDLSKFIPSIDEQPPIDPRKPPNDDRFDKLVDFLPVTQTLPSDETICVCLEIYFVGHIERRRSGDIEYLELVLDALEIVDIRPDQLEAAMECVIATALRVSILPKLRLLVPELVLNMGGTVAEIGLNVILGNLSLSLTPTSAKLPFNPSIEQNELRVCINAAVKP